MVIGAREGNILCEKFQDELRSRFTHSHTSFRVSMYRDSQHNIDIIDVRFHTPDGEEHSVKQEHGFASLWGFVGLEDKTIATIMLLLG